MERASITYIGVQPGDKILIKTPDGRKFQLTVTGRVHDLYRIPPFLEGCASIIGLVASTSGVALMMGKVLDYYRNPGVVAIPLVETIESKIVLAYLKNEKPSRSAKTFIRLMEKNLISQ